MSLINAGVFEAGVLIKAGSRLNAGSQNINAVVRVPVSINTKWRFLEAFGFVSYASMGAWHAAVTKWLKKRRGFEVRVLINIRTRFITKYKETIALMRPFIII